MKQYMKYKDLEYCLLYKNKKNISIRVKEGIIVVSAPFHTSISFIEDLLEQYRDKLIKQIQSYNPYYDLNNGGYVYIFNKKYTIVQDCFYKGECYIDKDKIIVGNKNINKSLSLYLYKLLYDYLIEKIIGYLSYDFDLDMPKVEIKKYKSKWGTCYYKENRISFNISLVHLEKELIDYVIVHELCHFLVHNHSSLFYNEIEARLPEYKSLIKKLKEKHV